MHPRSEHLGTLAWCLLDSVAWAAAVANTPASNKITGFSSEVMERAKALYVRVDGVALARCTSLHMD